MITETNYQKTSREFDSLAHGTKDFRSTSFVRIANRLHHNGRQARTALISDTVSGV